MKSETSHSSICKIVLWMYLRFCMFCTSYFYLLERSIWLPPMLVFCFHTVAFILYVVEWEYASLSRAELIGSEKMITFFFFWLGQGYPCCKYDRCLSVHTTRITQCVIVFIVYLFSSSYPFQKWESCIYVCLLVVTCEWTWLEDCLWTDDLWLCFCLEAMYMWLFLYYETFLSDVLCIDFHWL